MADYSSLSWTWDINTVHAELMAMHSKCFTRGLTHGAKWVAELASSLPPPLNTSSPTSGFPLEADLINEWPLYAVARSYYDLGEYDRASHFLDKRCSASSAARFLSLYCQYLAGEKRDEGGDKLDADNSISRKGHLTELYQELNEQKRDGIAMDAFTLYLYGVVLKQLDFAEDAVKVLVAAVHLEPCFWSAWSELSSLMTERNSLPQLDLPNHWMKYFFLGYAFLELQCSEEALSIYSFLADSGFSKSSHIISQIAVVHDNMKNFEAALTKFSDLVAVDPYRLENMDTYSNILFVKGMRKELADLSYKCVNIDKYRVETCCVVGNYYSIRGQHEKAVLYFQRALKLNCHYLSAWTLMGHEYMELKNTSAAIQSYRQALDVDQRDYRAWYGLGQTYEILKMPSYSLYYYKKAQQIRPSDSRMIVALGESYEKLERLQEAKKCFWKAHTVGDIEGIALIKLARLYERLSENDQAAGAYTEYANKANQGGVYNSQELASAYKFLANHHLKSGNLEEAYVAAQKCLEFPEVREEGKALLRQINNTRTATTGTPAETSTVPANGVLHANDTISEVFFGRRTDERPLPDLSPMNLTFTNP